MWSTVSHKSSSISSVVMAERDESLSSPPLHLIHMSICLLSMPLSKDYWCPACDIRRIMRLDASSNELTWRKKKMAPVTSPNHSQLFLLKKEKNTAFVQGDIMSVSVMTLLDHRWGVIWPLQDSVLCYLVCVKSRDAHGRNSAFNCG